MKLKIPNISFLDYIELPDKAEYNYYLRYGDFKPLDLFNFGDFEDQDFGFVKDMQEHLNHSGLSWQIYFKEVALKTGKSEKEIAKRPLFDLQCSRFFIKEQIERINTLESASLGHTAGQREIEAGIERFQKFRSFIQFDKLAGGDILKFDEIRKITYSICFTKLVLDAEVIEFKNRINKRK